MWFPRLATLVVTLLTATTTLAQNYPPPRACDGDCYTRDPAFIKRDDGTYFRFTTKRLIQIHTSKNINGPWQARGSVIQGRSIIDLPGNDDLWAPDISKVGDLYYLFYAVSTLGSKNSAIGYATSPSMEPGTWTDRGQILRSTDSSPYNAIDANLYHSADGQQLHFQWGSYWNGIFTQPVTINGPTVRLNANVAPKQVAYLPGDNNKALEGAFVYLQNGAYWLFTSRGKASEFGTDPNTFPAEQAYRVFVCRGDSPTGPFFGQLGKPCTEGGGTLVYGSQGNVFAPGGQGVWHDPEYGDVLYYHYFYKNVGFGDFQSRFGWNVLKWVDGWPVAT